MLLVLPAVTLVAYIPALNADYVKFDDVSYIQLNPLLPQANGLWTIWTDSSAYPTAVQWYPMTHTTYWLEYQLWGDDPRGYHVTNIVLHALNAMLVWLVCRQLRMPGAYFVALLFALHPVQVQSVAWIAERKNVLSGLFFLLTAWGWLRFADTGRWRWYPLVLLLFFLALTSKTAVCTLPVVLLAWIHWRRPKPIERYLVAIAPLLIMAVGMGLVTLNRETGYTVDSQGFGRDFTFAQNVLIAGRALWFYVGKLLWPIELIPIYPKWDIDPGVSTQWLFPVLAALLPAGLLLLSRWLGRGPLFAALFFGISLGPVLSFIDFGFLGHAYVTDHFLYLPCLGVLGLFVAAGARLGERWHTAGAAGVTLLGLLVAGALGVRTYQQAGVYRDAESFWQAVVDGNRTPLSLSARADVYLRKGDYANAERLLSESVAQRDSVRTRFRLGELCARQGHYREARAQFEYALEKYRRGRVRNEEMEVRLLRNIATTSWRLRDYAKAAEFYEKALELRPSDEETRRYHTMALQRAARESAEPPSTRPGP